MKYKETPLVSISFIEENSIPIPESGCWLWISRVNSKGYGYPRIYGGDSFVAHRLSFKAHNGYLDDNLNVNHKCDIKSCVNPAHLYAGTQLENIRDREVRGRGGDFKGLNNPRSDKAIYTFYNKKTKETFTGYRYYFEKWAGLESSGMSSLCSNKIKSHRNWVILNKETV